MHSDSGTVAEDGMRIVIQEIVYLETFHSDLRARAASLMFFRTQDLHNCASMTLVNAMTIQ
jgi:hypothetical protein